MLDAIVGGHGCNLKENNWKSVGGLGIEKVLMCNKEFLVACELGLFLACLPRQSWRGCQTRLWRDHPAVIASAPYEGEKSKRFKMTASQIRVSIQVTN